MCHPGQDVSPDCRVLAPAIIEHHHRSGRYIVDVIAYRARRLAGGSVENRVGAPGQAKMMIERLNSETLSSDPKPVHGVAERRRVQPGCALDVLILCGVAGHECYFFNMLS